MQGEARPGRYKMICDYSGFVGYNDEMVRTWNGLYVLRRFVGSESQRHPQDFVRAVPDNQLVPNPRPEPADTFLSPGDVTPSDL